MPQPLPHHPLHTPPPIIFSVIVYPTFLSAPPITHHLPRGILDHSSSSSMFFLNIIDFKRKLIRIISFTEICDTHLAANIFNNSVLMATKNPIFNLNHTLKVGLQWHVADKNCVYDRKTLGSDNFHRCDI